MPSEPNDHVVLAIPAAPEYVRLARLTAAGLASRLGFTYDDIEDLRIAVDELCYLLLGPDVRGGQLRLTFDLDTNALCITGEADHGVLEVEFAQLSMQILNAVVDEFEVSRNALRVVRRRRGT